MTTPRVETDVAIDRHERLWRSFEEWQEPGTAELCSLLQEMLGRDGRSDEATHLERLEPEVYRLRIGGGTGHTLVLKRLRPATSQIDRFVAERWLPALGLGDRCPRLLGAAAQRDGDWVWHIYEDLGHDTLALQRQPWRVTAAVDLIVELHTRAAVHPLLPEVRWRARDLGVHFFTSNLRDAIAALEALASLTRDVPPEFLAARARLLHRLHGLLEDAPRRVRVMEEVGGPDTLLHGDLWPTNVFVTPAANGPRARLIDWDNVGAGPFSYDLSTFLYRSSAEERPLILQRYRDGVERAGWRLPGNGVLNLLFHTAESARSAHCVVWAAMALLNEGARWGAGQLIEFDRWLEALRPPLPGETIP
ncbi:MAG: phosphotransferase family protein [Gemmatimonadales bacterium]